MTKTEFRTNSNHMTNGFDWVQSSSFLITYYQYVLYCINKIKLGYQLACWVDDNTKICGWNLDKIATEPG